jgi:acetate kinase
MKILVLNCGSSSVKFQLISTDLSAIEHNQDARLAGGIIERIGSEAIVTFRPAGKPTLKTTMPIKDHKQAIDKIIKWLISADAGIAGVTSINDIEVVGHRVVHGGEKLTDSVLINDAIIRSIEDCIDLAPLHNPANLKGITAVTEVFGSSIPQIAVFDTAFHHTLPEYAYLYAIPYQLYRRHRVRRYGFHGLSHRFVAYRYRQLKGLERSDVKVVSLHLGNGCSACAIQGGVSVDTSMGLTPLEGLVMGTRSGNIDAAILDYLSHKEGWSIVEVESVLNKESGLLGLSGLTNDMRELLDEVRETGDRRATLAIEVFCYNAKKYIGAYLAAIGGADAILFTGGIGENASPIRKKICEGLSFLGLTLDDAANAAAVGGREGLISTADSKLAAYVIPTNEELIIARDAYRTINNIPQR